MFSPTTEPYASSPTADVDSPCDSGFSSVTADAPVVILTQLILLIVLAILAVVLCLELSPPLLTLESDATRLEDDVSYISPTEESVGFSEWLVDCGLVGYSVVLAKITWDSEAAFSEAEVKGVVRVVVGILAITGLFGHMSNMVMSPRVRFCRCAGCSHVPYNFTDDRILRTQNNSTKLQSQLTGLLVKNTSSIIRCIAKNLSGTLVMLLLDMSRRRSDVTLMKVSLAISEMALFDILMKVQSYNASKIPAGI